MLLAACSGQPNPPAAESNVSQTAETTPSETANASMEKTSLTDLVLVDANTGEEFTLADFGGKTVSVEVMSVTCSACQKQHQNTVRAYEQLKNSDEYVFVSLSLDSGLSDAELKQFAETNGYDWVFAVATPETIQTLNERFGQGIFSTANTPQFTISENGEVSEFSTGFKEPDVLVSQLEKAREE